MLLQIHHQVLNGMTVNNATVLEKTTTLRLPVYKMFLYSVSFCPAGLICPVVPIAHVPAVPLTQCVEKTTLNTSHPAMLGAQTSPWIPRTLIESR